MTVDIESIKRKIKSLLSRTIENGATEAEALTCLEKAHKMIQEFNLDIEEILKDREAIQDTPIEIAYGIARMPEYKAMVNVMAKLYDCRMIIDFKKLEGQKYYSTFYRLVGTPVNIEYTNYMVQVVIDIMENSFKNYTKTEEYKYEIKQENPRRVRNSYIRGFMLTIKEKALNLYLQKQREIKEAKVQQTIQENNNFSLVVLNNEKVENYMSSLKGIKYANTSMNNFGKSDSSNAKYTGSQDGKSVSFNRPVSNTTKFIKG